jgi:hypothetical protein
MTRWNRSKNAKPCSTFPHVWAAIVGCTGKGHAWRYSVGNFGRQVAEYACPTCHAAKVRLDALSAVELRAELARLQAAAGVADYRLAEVRVLSGGRPVLTGKIDPHAGREALEQALDVWTRGEGSIDRVVDLIILIDADCKAVVARYCNATEREKLVAAYRAARA